jgi:hypothetical protein
MLFSTKTHACVGSYVLLVACVLGRSLDSLRLDLYFGLQKDLRQGIRNVGQDLRG